MRNEEDFDQKWGPTLGRFGHLGCCAYWVVPTDMLEVTSILADAKTAGLMVAPFAEGQRTDCPSGGWFISAD